MLILLTIFLLILIPFVMLVMFLARPKFSIQGFLVVAAALAGWPMVFLSRSEIPETITLLYWEPATFFPVSPALLIDELSWYFALALMSLSLAVIITSIAQIGRIDRIVSAQLNVNQEVNEVQRPAGITKSTDTPAMTRVSGATPSWQSWAGILVLTSFGLVAVTAANMLTLLLAWVALDIIELIILLSQVMQSKLRERIVLAFTARMAGVGLVFLAGIIPWSQGSSLTYEIIDQSTSIYLLLAAGLRLGVLPLHLPLLQQIPLRRGLGTALRLIPAAASFILLVRVADIGVLSSATPYLLGLTGLAGLYAGINWINSRDELNGRPYWLLGTASLAVASAILNLPTACLTWTMVSLLSGGLIFSMSIRHKNLFPVAVLGIINLTALPFTASWLGVELYQYPDSLSGLISLLPFSLISLAFLLTHALLLVGFSRHLLHGILVNTKHNAEQVERWVWFIYPLGLIFIIISHFIIGLMSQPSINDIPVSVWIMGAITVVISGIMIYFPRLFRHSFFRIDQPVKISSVNNFFSFNWLYNLLWRLFHLVARLISLLSTILEGDGGILWALVLFALIFVFLQR